MFFANIVELVQNLPFRNLDLLTVGLTIAAIGTLGFLVFINDRISTSNRTFFAFALITATWSFLNYISYKTPDTELILLLQRAVIFLGVWHSFTFLRLVYVFPDAYVTVPFWLRRLAPAWSLLVSIFTLTPLVFSGLFAVGANGAVSVPQPGPGILVFLLTSLGFILAGIYLLIHKSLIAPKQARSPYVLMTLGAIFMFALVVICNIVLPAVFLDVRFIPLGALFIFPFIAFTAYAIYQHRIFNVRNIFTALLTFLLCLVSFFEVIFASDINQIMLRSGIFVLALIISAQLVRNTFELEKANEERSEFMSFASHEIRNPITAMRGYASLIMDGTLGSVSDDVRKTAQRIMVEGNDVLSLISTYLNKSKLELGQISFEQLPFDAGKAAAQIVSGYVPHAEQKGLKLVNQIDLSHPFMVVGDEGKLKEVVGNIIDNSLKYTKEGSVTVAVERHGVMVRITVSDTGVGIPAETIPQLFKKFSRADAQRVNLLGTGIGLYLAKIFIDGQKGRIWVESDGVGKGARFIVELPVT